MQQSITFLLGMGTNTKFISAVAQILQFTPVYEEEKALATTLQERKSYTSVFQNVESEGIVHGTKTQFHSSKVLQNSGLSSACNKRRSGILDTARKIRRSKTNRSKDKEKLLETLKVSNGKRSRNKLDFNSSMEEDKRKDSLKNKRYKCSPGPIIEEDMNTIKKRNGQIVLNGSEDQIGNE